MSSPPQRHGDSPPPDGTGDADAPRNTTTTTTGTPTPLATSSEGIAAPENQEPVPAGLDGTTSTNVEGAPPGTADAPDPPTPAPPSPPAANNAGNGGNNRRRPLGSVTYFVPMPGGGPDGQQAQDGHQIVATLTMEIFANDEEGAAAAGLERPDQQRQPGDPDQSGDDAHGGFPRQPAGTEPTPVTRSGRDGENNGQAQGAEGADRGQRDGNERGGGGGGPILVFLDADGAPIQQGGDGGGNGGNGGANTDGGHTHTHTFTIPWPNFAFPFPMGPRPPDPAKAAELLNSLPTVGRALLKRVDKIVAAEDAKRGDSDSSGWQCGICLEGVPLGETVKALPCNHLFHEGCLQPWFTNHHHNCPTCRLNLDPLRTLHEPRDPRRNPLRPAATGSGRATPGGRANHPYARDGGARGSSRPGSNAGTRPSSPPPGERGADELPANPLGMSPNPLDAAIDIARMFPFTASPLPMRRDEQREGEGDTAREGDNPAAEPVEPATTEQQAGPVTAPDGTASPGMARPTPERRSHITIIRMPEQGERTPQPPQAPTPAEERPVPEQPQPAQRETPPFNLFRTPLEHLMRNFRPDAFPPREPSPAAPRAPSPASAEPPRDQPPADDARAMIEFELELAARRAREAAENGSNAAGASTPATSAPAAEGAGTAPAEGGETPANPPSAPSPNPASARGTPNPAAAPGDNADGGRDGPRGNGRHFRVPFELLFLSAGFGPPGATGPPPPETPAPEPQSDFVPQSLESWTAQREKTLGWRCDAVECLVAPPVPDADKMDIDGDGEGDGEDDEDEGVSLADKEMLAIYAPAQAPFPPRSPSTASVPPHRGHDFVLLACEHHWHRTCLETAARSAGHTHGPDVDGREWIRCARCRKEGWVVPREQAPAEAVPMQV